MSACPATHRRPTKTFTFKRIYVTVTPNGTAVIEWRLDRCFLFPGDLLRFYVETAPSGGEWIRLNPGDPVVNSCVYVDTGKVPGTYNKNSCGSMGNQWFYRVVANDGETDFFSQPESMYGVLSRHDWLIARDVVRKEYLALRKFHGTLGYLLKRREYGAPCSNEACLDWDTEQPQVSNCPLCYGTGFLRGYYDGIPFWIDFSAAESSKDVVQPFGTVDPMVRAGRCVAYPLLDTYDLWIDADKNLRFLVRKLRPAVEVRARALVYVGEFHQLPHGRIEYTVPVDQPPLPSSSEDPAPAQGGWTDHISHIEW